MLALWKRTISPGMTQKGDNTPYNRKRTQWKLFTHVRHFMADFNFETLVELVFP